MKAQVQVINADRAKRSVAALAKRLAGNDKVLIGVQKGAGSYEDGTPIAVIAAANHFGTTTFPKIPARPYLDVAIAKNQRRYANLAKHQVPKVLEGELDLEQVLDQMGLAAAADVQEYMVELRDPPNARYTIEKKGSDNPLIDDGHLRQSIRHEVASEPVEEGLS